MNLRKYYEEIVHTRSLQKKAILEKNLRKKTYEKRKKLRKMYDSLLADLGKHQTRIRKTYEIVTCLRKFVRSLQSAGL